MLTCFQTPICSGGVAPLKVSASVTAQVQECIGGGQGFICCMAHALCSVEWLWNVWVASRELLSSSWASVLSPPRLESKGTVGTEEDQGPAAIP